MILQTQTIIDQIIAKLNLQPHPEGGFYVRSFQSSNTVKSTDTIRYHDEDRYAGTAIYYLLKGNDFSAWHSLKSDEIWHYYKGCLIRIYIIDSSGNLTTCLLGDPSQDNRATFQVAIEAGNWFAAELEDNESFSFVGCTVTPGFDFKDFRLADRQLLLQKFPQHSCLINKLTRLTSNPMNENG